MPGKHTLRDKWRIYPCTMADQQYHIDEGERLLASIQPGDRPVLYWSIADPTAIVLGFSQRNNILNTAAVDRLALPVYRRRAGGTAVLVGPGLLSLDVVLPQGHELILPDIVESYRWFSEAWVAALAACGIAAQMVEVDEAHAQRDLRKQPATREYEMLMNRACYGSLSPYEVVVEQRKVVGFDMIRRRAGSLLQAGILLSWDSALLAQLLGHTAEEQALLCEGLSKRAVGLDMVLGHSIEAQSIIAAFEEALAMTY